MFSCLLTQILIGTPLYDGEQALLVAIERFCLIETLDATVEPTLCQAQRFLSIFVIALAWRTLIKGHHDIGTNDALGVHDVLGREDMA